MICVESMFMIVLLAMALFSSPKVPTVTHAFSRSVHQSLVGTGVMVGATDGLMPGLAHL